MQVIGVALPEEIATILKNIARERYCTKSTVARELIVKALRNDGLLKEEGDGSY